MCMHEFVTCFVTFALHNFRQVYHFLGAPRDLLGPPKDFLGAPRDLLGSSQIESKSKPNPFKIESKSTQNRIEIESKSKPDQNQIQILVKSL